MLETSKKVLTTLLVDYTVGSNLKTRIQDVEDEFTRLVGGGRVRVVEKGGMFCPTFSDRMTLGRRGGPTVTPDARRASAGPGSMRRGR